jgi:putative molybdopterin biosynthesis protein
VVTLAYREQGLMMRPGSSAAPTDLADLAEMKLRFVNRNPGSGTRVWLDAELRKLGVGSATIPGWETEVTTHDDVAQAVASGAADIGLGIRIAAENSELEFVPLFTERYDLVFNTARSREADIERLREQLESKGFKSRVRALGGYDTTHTGESPPLGG